MLVNSNMAKIQLLLGPFVKLILSFSNTPDVDKWDKFWHQTAPGTVWHHPTMCMSHAVRGG